MNQSIPKFHKNCSESETSFENDALEGNVRPEMHKVGRKRQTGGENHKDRWKIDFSCYC